MSHHDKDTVPEKVQEAVFNALLQRPENHQCADCLNKSPTWASVEFGVFLCIGCSGIHRQLGPHITRVKSSKLDKWRKDQVEIMVSVGNKLANDYYEYKLPKGFKRLDSNANPEEFSRFVKDKYIKKVFAPPNYPTPVEDFLTNKKNGLVVDLSFAKNKITTSSLPSNTQKEAQNVVRKKSLSLENGPESNNKQVPNQKSQGSPSQPNNQSQNQPFDLLSDDNIVPSQPQQTNQVISSSSQQNNTQNVPSGEPAKTGSAFDFDFSAIQKPQNQSPPHTQNQNGPQGQFQGLNQAQATNIPQQAQTGGQSSTVPDITKLYQQSNMYNNAYGMNQMNPMMMMNNGYNQYNNMQQQQQPGLYQNNGMYQNNQGWNQNQVQGQWNGNMGMQAPMNNMMQQQQMYQNNFNQQGFMQNNMYQQQQQFPQQQQYNNNNSYQMQNNGFPNQMNYAQKSSTGFF